MAGGTEFPKWLHHPGYSPAVLSTGAVAGPLTRGAHYAAVGRSAQFPPVIVHNRDDEDWYVSKGYEGGAYDHAKVLKQQIAPLPHGYVEREYPRYEADGSVTPDPNPPPVENYEFPKWVGDEIAQNAEEERAILARVEPALALPPDYAAAVLANDLAVDLAEHYPGADDDSETETLSKAEIAAFREWMAAGKPTPDTPREEAGETAAALKASRPAPRSTRGGNRDRGTAEQAELIELCTEAGIKVDNRYSVRRLRALLEAATAPLQERQDDAQIEESRYSSQEASVG